MFTEQTFYVKIQSQVGHVKSFLILSPLMFPFDPPENIRKLGFLCFDPPENIRKLGFLCFGGTKGNIGKNRVKVTGDMGGGGRDKR